jgi:hypothetical protein
MMSTNSNTGKNDREYSIKVFIAGLPFPPDASILFW